MTINDITPSCRKCQHSQWCGLKKDHPKRLFCVRKSKYVQEEHACIEFEPSKLAKDFFAGRLKDREYKIVRSIFGERYRTGRL